MQVGCMGKGAGCRARGFVQAAGLTAGCRVWSRAVGQPHHGAVWYGMIPATWKVCCGHLRGQARPRLRARPQTRGMEATSSSGAIPHHDAQRAWKVAARTQGAENQQPEHRSREDQRQHFWGVCGLHPLEEAWGQRQEARQQPAVWCTAVLAWPGAAEAS